MLRRAARLLTAPAPLQALKETTRRVLRGTRARSEKHVRAASYEVRARRVPVRLKLHISQINSCCRS